jgi:hypothetical protein
MEPMEYTDWGMDENGIASALWSGAKGGYHTYRAKRLTEKAERHKRKAAEAWKNPGSHIPGNALQIRYRRTGGQLYYHNFKPGVRMIVNGNGTVTLAGRERVWADDRWPGFWDKYGHHRNPGRRRMARRRSSGGGISTTNLLLLGAAGFLVWKSGLLSSLGIGGPSLTPVQRPGDLQAFIPQPNAFWINPDTGIWVQAGADGVPPGSVPPWRLMSDQEYAQVVMGTGGTGS